MGGFQVFELPRKYLFTLSGSITWLWVEKVCAKIKISKLSQIEEICCHVRDNFVTYGTVYAKWPSLTMEYLPQQVDLMHNLMGFICRRTPIFRIKS